MRQLVFWLCASFAIAVNAQAPEPPQLDMSGCVFADTPTVPDGTSATGEMMSAVGTAIREYVASMQDALGCLDALEKSLGQDITDAQRAQIATRYNGGVDNMNAVAAAYNEQVRAYKAANEPAE